MQPFNSSQDIINHFTGQGKDTSEVLLKNILETEKRINKKKELFSLFGRLNADKEYNDCVRLYSLNAKKIQKILLGCAAVGAAVGAVFSSIFLGAMTYKGALVGGGCGLGLGVGYCVKKDLFSLAWEDAKTVNLKMNERLESFRNECTVDQYKLFTNFIENYGKFVDDKKIEGFQDVFCSITLTIPEIPVFSPHDKERKYVFEKSAIEKHLDNVDNTITKATLSGASQEKIAELRTTYCPFRGPAFTKKELVTDIKYLNKVIDLVKESLKSISENVKSYEDPIIQKGLQCLLDHYKSHHKQCSGTIVDKLFDDCIKLGTPRSMIKEVCNAFEESFDEKKNI